MARYKAFKIPAHTFFLAMERAFGVYQSELVSFDRSQPLASIRQLGIAMLIEAGAPRPHIARLLGRSESTIKYTIEAHRKRLKKDKAYHASWMHLPRTVGGIERAAAEMG